jgi:hypothetical protein
MKDATLRDLVALTRTRTISPECVTILRQSRNRRRARREARRRRSLPPPARGERMGDRGWGSPSSFTGCPSSAEIELAGLCTRPHPRLGRRTFGSHAVPVGFDVLRTSQSPTGSRDAVRGPFATVLRKSRRLASVNRLWRRSSKNQLPCGVHPGRREG